jgi:FkbM family methyltransferase
MKNLYPNAKIVAFEPDPNIFSILKDNISSFAYNDVEINNWGLWNTDKIMNFYSEGADGGRIEFQNEQDEKTISVKLKSLKPYLNKKVDFLKIDIEGAEDVVLEDIKNELDNVDRIFIEYHSFEEKNKH